MFHSGLEAFQLFILDLSGLYRWEPGCERQMRDLQPKLFLPFDPARRPTHQLAAPFRM